jgi:hypothetical protein
MLTQEQWQYVSDQLDIQYAARLREIDEFIAMLKAQSQVISVPPKVSSGYSVWVDSGKVTFDPADVSAEIKPKISQAEAKKLCTCPMNLLLLRGCKCGGS